MSNLHVDSSVAEYGLNVSWRGLDGQFEDRDRFGVGSRRRRFIPPVSQSADTFRVLVRLLTGLIGNASTGRELPCWA